MVLQLETMNKLLEKYNHSNNLIIISSYPEKRARYSQKVCAVGGYTKNLVNQFTHQQVIILTTKFGRKNDVYQDKKNLVIRFFKRNSVISFFSLIYHLVRFNKIDKVLVQFEFASFGETPTSGLFIFLPLIIKLLNKKTYFVFHQVLTDTQEIEEYLGWKKHDIKNFIFTPFLKLFYRLISFFSDQVVVLEEDFKQRLIDIGVKSDKIIVIPHGVDDRLKIIPKNTARDKLRLPLNKKIILYFGYLTWYKGADIFLRMARNDHNKDNYYVIAGGPSFSQKNKPHYKKYLKRFSSLPKNCRVTGFVPEKFIPLYFSACDLVVLPYRTMISSSGPLSLAFTFEKPVLLSDNLKPYVNTDDFNKTMKYSYLTKKDLFFSIDNKGNYSLKLVFPKINKITDFSRKMRVKRSFRKVSKDYLTLLNDGEKNTIKYYDLAFQKISR